MQVYVVGPGEMCQTFSNCRCFCSTNCLPPPSHTHSLPLQRSPFVYQSFPVLPLKLSRRLLNFKTPRIGVRYSLDLLHLSPDHAAGLTVLSMI
jgi:hypothetical protein